MTRRYTLTVRVACPACGETVPIDLRVEHDPGCWRTPNGDGWPESWDYEATTAQCPCGSRLDGSQADAWTDRIEAAFNDRPRPEPGDDL